MTGYLDPAYIRSLAEFGEPVGLPASGGWLLKRAIGRSADADAMGGYPLFACNSWEHLAGDIAALDKSLVAVSLVTDPFGGYTADLLRKTFESVRPFKSHFIVEPVPDPAEIASGHHRYYARRALEKVRVESVRDLGAFLPDWCRLYRNLILRHGITGIQAFSDAAFELQFEVGGLIAFRALIEGRVVGAHLWMLHGEVAHSHLAAFSEEGYRSMCSYALYWEAIRHFTGRARWLNLGAGAGWEPDTDDGLTRFKRGWSTGSRTAWFCSTVLQPEKYARLRAEAGAGDTGFFPAYRATRQTL